MSYNSSYGLGATGYGPTVGEKYLITRPKLRSNQRPTAVLYSHGSGGAAGEMQTWGGVRQIMAKIANAGYLVLSADLGGPAMWGNTTAQTRTTEAYNWLISQPGITNPKIHIVGLSAGGGLGFSWAANNGASKVASVTGLIPVTDITDIHTNNRDGAAGAINTAYGGAWSQATFGANHNPMTQATAGKLTAIPTRVYYGSTDTICVPARATAFGVAAGSVLTQLSGGHAETTVAQINPSDIVAFLKTNGA